MKWYFVAVLLTVLTSSQGILTTLSQTKGSYLYDYATVPFLAELYKLVVSASLLWRETHTSLSTRITTEWKTVRLYPIPSIIYLIHNNVQFATLTYVDTSTYQIMGNLKIVTTGILFRLFLKRKLSNLQWMAIVLLAVGTTTSQVKGCGEGSCESLFSAPIHGFGVIFNMAKLIVDDFQSGFEKGPWWQRLFNGYSITTWLVVLNLGSTGLLVSWLMKYADNIVKVTPTFALVPIQVYSTSMAMLLTMVLSVFMFSFKPTLQLFLGIIICMMSLHMYFAPPNKLVDLPAPIKPDPEALKEVSIDGKTDS
ncbi:CMP-sialic acid transporter 1 [Linum perenne]